MLEEDRCGKNRLCCHCGPSEDELDMGDTGFDKPNRWD